eukprot:7284246-Pyramimonas_sp.AAC.1
MTPGGPGDCRTVAAAAGAPRPEFTTRRKTNVGGGLRPTISARTTGAPALAAPAAPPRRQG